MTQLKSYLLLWLFFTSISSGCDTPMEKHACDSCRPCEECKNDPETGVAACIAPSHVQQGCKDGAIIWFDACNTPEDPVKQCSATAVCMVTEGEAECTCLNRWEGEDCDQCPDGFDASTNCASCLPHHNGADECQSCIGNFDIETACMECTGKWTGENCDICPAGYDETTGCDVCAGNRDMATQCTRCLANWSGVNCDVCPPRFDATTGCTECANHWTGEDCSICPENFTAESDCTECSGNLTGINCSLCSENFTVESGCTECANQWTGDACDVCPDNFVRSSNCTLCANQWEGDNCDICPVNFNAALNCSACANHWTGKTCDVCPENFTADSNCSECANQWTGDACDVCPGNFDADNGCTACINRWTGDDCNICPVNFTVDSGCTECANHWYSENCDACPTRVESASNCSDCINHWTGDNCNECPINFDSFKACNECINGWTGDDCNECPANFIVDSNCHDCANEWTGDACDVCPANFTEESNCTECAGNWTGSDCNQCPSAFGGEDCDATVALCVRYVDGDLALANPSGMSWGTAFSKIQDAIDSASAAMAADGGTQCEVWVKDIDDGYFVYQSAPTDTIALASGIALRGGFSGTETTAAQRTVLPGGINRSHINCHHEGDTDVRTDVCITAHDLTDVTLDGFLLWHGSVGVDVQNIAMHMQDVMFQYFTHDGPGACVVANNAELTGERIECLYGSSDSGTAIHATGSTLTVSDSRSPSATTGNFGGAIYSDSSEIHLNRWYDGNTQLWPTGSHGGFLYATNSQIYLDGCNLTYTSIGSDTTVAGGFIFASDSTFSIRNSRFESADIREEITSVKGTLIASINSTGIIENTQLGPTLTPCMTGLIHNENASLRVINSTISGVTDVSTCPDAAVIFTDNAADTPVEVVNSVLWSNGFAYTALDAATPSTSITYSIVESDTPGTGNIVVPYETGDEIDVDANFPGIDAGNGDVAPALDKAGNARMDDPGTVNTGVGTPDYTDIGAVEYQP
jgi:hypothetical protein